MNMDDALQTFVIESRELLEQMEESLLHVEQFPEDADAIAAIFRAAHTIKGSAGLFGLDHIVGFTHFAESVLDRVRNGELAMDSALVALFLSVGDHIGTLIDQVAAGQERDAGTQGRGEALVGRLKAYLLPPPGQGLIEHPGTVPPEAGPVRAEADLWHLSLRFSPGVLGNGMDPLAFIRYLTTFGDIERIVTLTEAVPRLAELDAELNYLGYEIRFRTTADKATIEGAFEFVRDDAQIRILPPDSKVSDYLHLIADLPEEDMRLGEILVLCGSVTRAELEAALSRQAAEAGGEHGARPLGEVLVSEQMVRPRVVEAALDRQKQVKDHKAAEAGVIRINADKLDQHINLIGELIIASAGISLNAQRQRLPELLEATSLLSRLVEEIRDSALQLRMVPIGATFNKFQRVVRDVSVELGKDIRLEISGADTELDKTVVEKIGDPLTHLVRNAMDHGIEPAEVRAARGKPAHGTVRLNAFHDAGSIVVEVADDGGGLDRERILRKAIERGLVKPEQALTDNEVYNLIFAAGLSTAETVNNLSGRGVGMDVVRRNITALRGSIDIDSQPGQGTSIQIRLPLTLAIIDGFLVSVGASSFVIPLEMVVECVELDAEAAATGRDQLNLRGEVLPFIRLKEMFDIADAPPPAVEIDDGVGLAGSVAGDGGGTAQAVAIDPELAFLLQPVKRDNVVVVQYAGQRAGLVVDMLLGEFQTVIRPLGTVFAGLEGVSGFTILGSGQVALILDVPGLVRRVVRAEDRPAAVSRESAPL